MVTLCSAFGGTAKMFTVVTASLYIPTSNVQRYLSLHILANTYFPFLLLFLLMLFWRRSALGFLWREWCWSWNSSTLATSWEELTHWKRPWCWEGLGAGGEGDDRGCDGWMASPTRWMWVWVNSGSWWWTGRPDVLRFMGSRRVGHDWATELNWILGGMKWYVTAVLICIF